MCGLDQDHADGIETERVQAMTGKPAGEVGALPIGPGTDEDEASRCIGVKREPRDAAMKPKAAAMALPLPARFVQGAAGETALRQV